ncbi:hypothetical protein ACFE04_009483 [Oxalis oulophora]
MAESVVSFLAGRLGNMAVEEAKFLNKVGDQVRQMHTELLHLRSFLRDADKRQEEDQVVRNWISEIREAAYDIEDVINTFTMEVASRRGPGVITTLKRYAFIFKEYLQLHRTSSEIETIKAKISDLTTKLQNYGISPLTDGESLYGGAGFINLRRTHSHYEEDVVVGFKEDLAILVSALLDESRNFRVVSICGMGGLGKTTLAKEVYKHRDIRRRFDGFAWVYVSQQCQTKDVWEQLLLKLIAPSLEQAEQRSVIASMKPEELAKKLYMLQQEKKYLVVIDDIWTPETWESLKPAFPLGKGGSKILLTSRNKDLALHVDPRGFLLNLRFLTDDESWDLFEKKALLNEADPDFEKLGRNMVKKCGGLPLAIVILGGMLAKKPTLNYWNSVEENIDSYFRKGRDKEHDQSYVQKVLALSYRELPYRLKPCFLYLSHFPEDFEISATRLIRMWVAEGFVLTTPDQVEKDDLSENLAGQFLQELIDRSMIQPGKITTSGRVKTCRLHDLMRDLSISIAQEENFFKILHLHDETVSSRRVHRLAVRADHENSDLSILASGDERNINLRALLFLEGKEIKAERRELKSMFNKFKLLRVLEIKCISPTRLPKEIGELVYLRSLTLHIFHYRTHRDSAGLTQRFLDLPYTIGNLTSLQTLELLGDSLILDLPNVIWKISALKYLHFPSNSRGCKLHFHGLKYLQILENLDARTCDVDGLSEITNLRKLTVYSMTPFFLRIFSSIFCKSGTLGQLRSLSLKSRTTMDISDAELSGSAIRKLYIHGELLALPTLSQFPNHITKLILSSSKLNQDPMPTLEQLESLRILRLHWNAFAMKKMVCSDGGFLQLRSLVLNELHHLETWKVDKGAMPRLSHLAISRCTRLKNVPKGLRFIRTLQELEIRAMSAEFKERIKGGGKDFDIIQHVKSVIIA